MQLVSILCFHLLSSIGCLASLIISFLASLSHLSEGKDLPWRLQSDDRTFLFLNQITSDENYNTTLSKKEVH